MTLLGIRAPARPDEVAPKRPVWVSIGVVVALVAAVAARFATTSDLWLDEALTVNIARLPLRQIPQALRGDGSPPLYYMLLHVWMSVFGSGDFAVRALSGVMAVVSLPLAWAVGRRLSGRTVGWAAVLLLASSPFAIRYGIEVRMYSTVVAFSLVGMLALMEVLQKKSWQWSALLALATSALLFTHYWAFYLVAATGVGLVVRSLRGDEVADALITAANNPLLRVHPTSAGARRALLAMSVGALTIVPWVPSLLHQVTTTGTPWGRPPTLRVLLAALLDFTGGYPEASLALGLVAYALCGFGTFGRAAADGQVHMDLRGRLPGRVLALAVVGTLGFGVIVGQLTGSAFVIRYAAVAFPSVIVLMALGIVAFPTRSSMRIALAITVALGFATSLPGLADQRTTAGRVAAAIRSEAIAGDVVTYCPDQLGPSVSRLLPADLVSLTFPRGDPPDFLNWARYAEVNRAANPEEFARNLLARAGSDHDVWVVWAPGYRTFGSKCEALITALREVRPNSDVQVKISRKTYERPGLVRFRPSSSV